MSHWLIQVLAALARPRSPGIWTLSGRTLMSIGESPPRRLTRRDFSRAVALGGAALLSGGARAVDVPAAVTPDAARPAIPFGVASGDVASDGRAVVWSKTDRPARMVVEYSTTESFADARRVVGPAALDVSDY